jgi:hypothetical protein
VDQILHPNAKVAFPLSPTRLLCVDNLRQPENQYYPLSASKSREYNFLTWVNTDQFMISPRHTDEVIYEIDQARLDFEREELEKAKRQAIIHRYGYKKRKKRK